MSFVKLLSNDHVLQKVLAADSESLQKLTLTSPSGNIQLKYVGLNFVKSVITESGDNVDSQPGIASQSDLVPGVYEGGFKVWESTRDTVELILANKDLVAGKRVIDVGCGSGLIGIACILAGASHVTFQDYNESVIKWYTLPNAAVNSSVEADCVVSKLQDTHSFISGDWSDVAKTLEESALKYDVIFTSETIYNEDNYGKLTNLIRTCLNPNGKAYVAGKTYYFGVGGGMRSFEEFLESDGHLQSRVLKEIDAPVRREILEVFVKQ